LLQESHFYQLLQRKLNNALTHLPILLQLSHVQNRYWQSSTV